MSNLRKVTIDIYDAEGELCESIIGPMDYEDVREKMIEIIKNDGVPVVRIKGEVPKKIKVENKREEVKPLFPPLFPDLKPPVTATVKIGDTVSLSLTGGGEQIEDAIKRSMPDMLKAWEQIEKAKTTEHGGCLDSGMAAKKN